MASTSDHLANQPRPTMSWFIVALGIITAIGPLSIDMYLPAFNDISASLGASMASVQRSLTGYFIGLAIGQMLYGPIADRFGRKRPLQFGLGLYLVASVGCALSTNISMLIAMRTLQALGGSAGPVIGRAMVRDRFHHNHSARVFSLLTLVFGVAPIVAPILGGNITVWFGWRMIFWFLTAMSAACLLMTFWMPETRAVDQRTKEISPLSVLKVYRGIFRDRNFVIYALMAGFIMATMFAYIAGAPFVLMNLYHVRPEHFGWVFGSNALGFVIAAQLNSRLLVRIPFQRMLTIASSVLVLAGFYLIAIVALHGPLYAFLPGLFICVSMLGFVLPNTTAGAMENQAQHAGAASAMAGTLQFMVASFATVAVSLLQNGSAYPMVMVMTASSLIAWSLYHFIPPRHARA